MGKEIAFHQPELRPLADILVQEMQLVFDHQMTSTQGKIHTGNLRLEIDRSLGGETYILDVDEAISVRGGSYNAVSMGTVSLMQSVCPDNSGNCWVQCMSITDSPEAGYRGLMIDLARKWHPIETVKMAILLCRWYKINFIHLHLSDTESCVFPSQAYPQLATPSRHYSLSQLTELETFARDRGVTIIPELEMPGHARSLTKSLLELNCSEVAHTMCAGKQSTYCILDTLIGEISNVFESSPYFHIGCDEVNTTPWESCGECSAYMSKNELQSPMELYRHFIVKMNECVKRHGKKTIVWEGFQSHGKVDIPRDITVMVFECMYNLPQDLIADGYQIINTAWQPLYVVNKRAWTPEEIYTWNMFQWKNWFQQSAAYGKGIEIDPTAQVLGAQMCSWEQLDEVEIPSLRHRLPSMSERIWNPGSKRSFQDFIARIGPNDERLTSLLQPYMDKKNGLRDAEQAH